MAAEVAADAGCAGVAADIACLALRQLRHPAPGRAAGTNTCHRCGHSLEQVPKSVDQNVLVLIPELMDKASRTEFCGLGPRRCQCGKRHSQAHAKAN